VAAESKQLADFVAETRFDDLPSDVADRMKTFVLDSLAAGFVGCRLPWSQIVYGLERDKGSSGRCSVFGSGTMMSASSAAFVNGTMVGAFEAEHSGHTAHAGGTVVPAALAAAEASHIGGRELVLACVMGYEVVSRVGDAQTRLTEDERGFHNPAANGPFSSAAAVGKVLGLDAAHQLNAFGIAGSFAGGLTEFAWRGEMTKRLHIGLANRGGLEAAFLAQRGFTGPGTVLEGKFGYLNAFSPTPKPELLVAGLGTDWLTRDVKIKPFAAHGTVQAVIAALQQFKNEHPINASDVTAVHVQASAARMLQTRFLDPKPKTLLQAQLSMPYVVAVTLTRDLSYPLQFDESTLTDAEIQRLASVVTWEEVDMENPAFARLTITAGGDSYDVFAGDYRGSETQPADWDDIVDKFRRFSKHVLDAERQDSVIALVDKLDAVSDVGELMSLVRV
jgi:2-methylcitrate dehydratase PrpD